MAHTYSPARLGQLRLLLRVGFVVSALLLVLAVWVVVGGVPRFGLFVGVPALLACLAGFLTMRDAEGEGAGVRRGCLAVGGLLVLMGLLLASTALGVLPSLVGIALVLFALLPDHGERP